MIIIPRFKNIFLSGRRAAQPKMMDAMLNSSEEELFLSESTSKDICAKSELQKVDVESVTEPAKLLGEEYSKRDEDSDESTLLDPASGTSVSLQSTLEDIDEARRGIGDPDDPCPQRPRYCTGCSPLRIVMSPMAILVLGLVGMTYYAYVIETSDASILELLVFHVLIALLVGYEVHLRSVPLIASRQLHSLQTTVLLHATHARHAIALLRAPAPPLPPDPVTFRPVGACIVIVLLRPLRGCARIATAIARRVGRVARRRASRRPFSVT
jgi:hypothetical protein